jgi:D-beta-D-heptose 7-phosphate kinase/D-beta-D-heptose 1-phosphate adenosyltransferase
MKKIVVNGTFDLIHPGHIHLINYAKSLGDFLLVLIDTDRRVRKLKGDQRPIQNQETRKLILENLKSVDKVILFDSDEELIEHLKLYQADIMVKGSDYQDKSIIGYQYCKNIIFFERIIEYSTTNTVKKIIKENKFDE